MLNYSTVVSSSDLHVEKDVTLVSAALSFKTVVEPLLKSVWDLLFAVEELIGWVVITLLLSGIIT